MLTIKVELLIMDTRFLLMDNFGRVEQKVDTYRLKIL